MCGIAGILGLSADEIILKKMQDTMVHRGPDENGVFRDTNCCLLHSRLTIVAPEAGRQPMTLLWEGEHYTIVYNGELYNTAELQSQLNVLGHQFTGHSDTETLLHAYVQWKENALKKLNGIYSFAVWHHKEQKLFVARDRIGVKPLFFTLKDNGLLFASEIKTILSHPSVKAELDAEGASQLILLGPGRIPGSGVFRGIQELEPGCYGIYQSGKLEIIRYWRLQDVEHKDSFEQTADRVRYLVTDSIRRQMVSDFPIGAFLSGGLDSSLICSVCSEEMKHNGMRLKTFSVGYANNEQFFSPGKFQPSADDPYIQEVSQYLNTEHFKTILSPEDLVGQIENATIARDLPGMADVDFSLLAFSREIRKEVKVALSGECADEIFGGYPWFTDPEVRELDGFPWAQNTKYRSSFLQPWIKDGLDPEEFVNNEYKRSLLLADVSLNTTTEERRMKQMILLNFRWFMQTLLDRKDRMSMYTGLEVRVPFCDHRLAEYMYSVPWAFKYHQNREKGLLRYAMRGMLPDSVLYRKKSPYPKTYDPQYLQLVSQKLRDVLENKSSPILQIVRKEALESLFSAEYTWPWYGQLMKVPQTIAYMLQVNYWLCHNNVQIV